MMIWCSVLIRATRCKFIFFILRIYMNCEYCNCKLRKCKFELVENRTFHYKCYEIACKRKRQEELENFLEFFKSHGIIVKV